MLGSVFRYLGSNLPFYWSEFSVQMVHWRRYLQQEQDDRRKMASDMVVKLKDKLTETQFRRLWMHEVEEKTLEEIAALENVAFQSVHESIESAKKKILKIFKKTP